MKILSRLLAGTVLLSASSALAAEPPVVVTSFKPVQSLVAGVMEGVSTPGIIIANNASPHTYTMKPSNAAELEKAKVVFWIGPGFEHFLEKPLESLAAGARSVELSEAPGIQLLDTREGGAFEKHSHGEEEAGHDGEGHDHADHDDDHDHDHEAKDMHVWLNPENARAMTKEIVKVLAEIDPANAASYEKNGAAQDERLAALDKELATTLAAVKDRPFIVFHDAYQYMESRYGLQVAGSITVNPETMPGAARVKDIRAKIDTLGATCVFSEPEFQPRIVNALVDGTKARSAELNPAGGALPVGPDLYFMMMRENADTLVKCLTGK